MEEQIKQMEEAMLSLAEKHGVEPTENLPKIAKARVRMKLDITVCPCAHSAEEKQSRGCISAMCLREIKELGMCKCTAYRRKEEVIKDGDLETS
jgi:ferredoxin-thioredoxin reductase catalytic subunit